MSIIPNLPDTTLAYQRKYGNPDTLTYLAQLSSPTRNALVNFDRERAMRGARPLSERETLLATQAAEQQRAITQPRERGGISGFFDDLRGNANAILGSVLHLPGALVNEVQSLPDLATQLPNALATADNPIDAVSNVAALPGIRMLPGAFIAENIQTPGVLLDNPLFTAMDVLPGARALGKSTRVGRAAMQQGARGPLRALATRTLDESGNLVPNRLGQLTETATSAAKRTRPGQAAMTAFGSDARAMARLESEYTSRLRSYVDPEQRLPDDSPELARIVRRNSEVTGQFERDGLPKARQAEIISEMQMNPEKMSSYTDIENAYVNRFREMNDLTARRGIEDGDLAQAIVGDTPEIYDVATAQKVIRVQKAASSARAHASARNFHTQLNAGELRPQAVIDHLYGVRDSRALSLTARKSLIEGDLAVLRAANLIDQPTFKALRREVRNSTAATISDFRPQPLATLDTANMSRPLARLNDTLTRIENVEGWKDPGLRINKLRNAIANENYSKALELARGMRKVKRYAELDVDGIANDILAVMQQQKFLDRTSRYTNKLTERITKQERSMIERAVPGRFQPKVDAKFEELVEGKIRDIYSTDPKLDDYLRLAKERNYALIEGLNEVDFRHLQREAQRTWLDLKAAGHNPVFVHRVRPEVAKALPYSRVTDRPRTPSQVKQRMGDLSSFSDDASVILTHQGMEWLARRGSQEFVDEIGKTFGRTRREVTADYLELARKKAGDNPRAVQEELTKLMEKEWVKFPPDHLQGYGRARASATSPADEILIPRHAAKVMEQLYDAPLKGLTAATDPIMNVFRTSLLPLSPRWHMYNILGGGVVMFGRAGPGALKHIRAAYNMVKSGDVPEGVSGGGFVSAPADFAEYSARGQTLDNWIRRASESERVSAAFGASAGATMRRLWDQSQMVRDKGGKLVQKSYKWNQQVDDFYRAVSYLYESDKALTKGMSRQAAHDAGIALVRKTMQNWDEMTPLERTVMRNIFPFYGWMAHIMRYVLNYPIDHPVRASVVSAFARNEMEDWSTGLPRQFAQLFYWGDMDDNGNITAINPGGANPFSDVANYFTIAGFTGNASPLIGAVLRLTGVDTSTGTADLYPTLRYDPETGRMVAERPNAIATIAESILPQSRLITNMTGMSTEIRDLIQHNPDSARRYLQSTLGLPVLTREVNIPEEYFKTELRRDREQREQLNASLRSGNIGAMREYPGLNAVADQLAVLEGTGQLAPFQPQRDDPNYAALLQQAATLGMMS